MSARLDLADSGSTFLLRRGNCEAIIVDLAQRDPNSQFQKASKVMLAVGEKVQKPCPDGGRPAAGRVEVRVKAAIPRQRRMQLSVAPHYLRAPMAGCLRARSPLRASAISLRVSFIP